mmetsp:Transcript_56157/g.112541  ORF Transcript_56157/g.112541 Transcript_56157/m.112541 type:complete len:199 (+) Transcript_56157:76-672(+)
MSFWRAAIVSFAVGVAALALQGCGKKQPAGASAGPSYGGYGGYGGRPSGRFAVDGKPCEHGWHAKWRDGKVSFCRTYCCYHHDRITGRRTTHSYCRVKEMGREELRVCGPAALLLEANETEPSSLAELGSEADLAAAEAEESAEPEELTSLAERLQAVPLLLVFSGVAAWGAAVFFIVRSLRRRSVGSEEQNEPCLES